VVKKKLEGGSLPEHHPLRRFLLPLGWEWLFGSAVPGQKAVRKQKATRTMSFLLGKEA